MDAATEGGGGARAATGVERNDGEEDDNGDNDVGTENCDRNSIHEILRSPSLSKDAKTRSKAARVPPSCEM